MKKFKPINTYTKKDIIWYLKTFNNNMKSIWDGACTYKAPNDNHCAVGCFIPHDHKGLDYTGTSTGLLVKHPDLQEYMPLGRDALYQLQGVHDRAKNGSVHADMLDWVERNVEG